MEQKTSPTVSVIIPTYKHRNFVLATLDSVFAQTFTDYEVIVINDGSPDDTAELLQPLADAGRIRYIGQENTGQSIARNRGIEEARGEFIALLDDDDLWPPDNLEWQVAAMARHPDVGVVAGTASVIDEAGDFLFRSEAIPEISFERCFIQCPFISPGQALIRTSVIQQVNGLNPEIWGTDDWELWLRIARVSRVVMEDRTSLFYRKHAGGASKNLSRMLDNCFRVVDIHAPNITGQQRREVIADTYQRLYATHGKPIVLQVKQEIKSGKLLRLLSCLLLLAKFGKMPNGSLIMIVRIVRDFLPLRWSAHLHRPISSCSTSIQRK